MRNSHFQFTLGEFECTALRDGGQVGSTDFLFVNAPSDELKTALQKHDLELDQLWSTWTCLLVDTGQGKLLVDTGVGSGDERGGNLLPQLGQVGVRPEDIDMVFLTHGHPDHLGGCTGADDKPAFPRARYMIAKPEYQFWMDTQHQEDMYIQMEQIARTKLSAIEAQLELVEAEAEIIPGIRTIDAIGHTPGHLGLEIHSQGETLLNLADSVLHPLHLEHPEWYSRVDVLPEQMIVNRKRLLERAARETTLVLFFHFEFPSLGYVEKASKGWRWRVRAPLSGTRENEPH